jgi:hypothetical protein
VTVYEGQKVTTVSDLTVMLLKLVHWIEGEGSIVPTKLVAEARKLAEGNAENAPQKGTCASTTPGADKPHEEGPVCIDWKPLNAPQENPPTQPVHLSAIAFVREFDRALGGDEDGGVREWMRDGGDGALLDLWTAAAHAVRQQDNDRRASDSGAFRQPQPPGDTEPELPRIPNPAVVAARAAIEHAPVPAAVLCGCGRPADFAGTHVCADQFGEQLDESAPRPEEVELDREILLTHEGRVAVLGQRISPPRVDK